MASNEEGARKRRASVKSLLTAIVALAMLATTAEVARADTVVPNITITIIETPGVTIVPVVVGACDSTTNPTCLISAGGDVTHGEDTNFTVNGYTTAMPGGGDVTQNIDILEPGTSPTVSDFVQIKVFQNGALYVQFVSDGSALFLTDQRTVDLTVHEPAIGGPFELVPFGGFSGRFSGIKSFIVQSDPSAAVPEPASLLLLGSGLAGLAAWRRRHS